MNFNLRSEYQGASLHSLTLFPARPLQSSLRLPRAEGIFHAQWMWASKWSLSRFEEMDIQPDSVPQRTRHLHKYRPLMMSNGCLEQFYMHPTLIHTLYDIESVTVLHYAINESKGRGIAIRGRLQRARRLGHISSSFPTKSAPSLYFYRLSDAAFYMTTG